MTTLRSNWPSRLRQLLSSEGAIGPSIKLDSEPVSVLFFLFPFLRIFILWYSLIGFSACLDSLIWACNGIKVLWDCLRELIKRIRLCCWVVFSFPLWSTDTNTGHDTVNAVKLWNYELIVVIICVILCRTLTYTRGMTPVNIWKYELIVVVICVDFESDTDIYTWHDTSTPVNIWKYELIERSNMCQCRTRLPSEVLILQRFGVEHWSHGYYKGLVSDTDGMAT